ncbi:hypothetical protein GG344DRAFT_70552 [Lentinula edodes]|nr:hypothetical protein GG344DRAFT_70552 [Lentinula edodes]
MYTPEPDSNPILCNDCKTVQETGLDYPGHSCPYPVFWSTFIRNERPKLHDGEDSQPTTLQGAELIESSMSLAVSSRKNENSNMMDDREVLSDALSIHNIIRSSLYGKFLLASGPGTSKEHFEVHQNHDGRCDSKASEVFAFQASAELCHSRLVGYLRTRRSLRHDYHQIRKESSSHHCSSRRIPGNPKGKKKDIWSESLIEGNVESIQKILFAISELWASAEQRNRPLFFGGNVAVLVKADRTWELEISHCSYPDELAVFHLPA